MELKALYQIYLQHPVISTDSRQVQPNDLFIALHGDRFDGNRFAQQALDKGAAYAVVDDPTLKGERFIHVSDTLQILQSLARHHRTQLNVPVIAITGSNGKTTTKELCTAVLRERWQVWATPGNFNNHIGLPLTILRSPSNTELLLLEMGDNKPGDIRELCEIALPDFGYITNVGKDHLAGYGSQEENVATKAELFDYLRAHQKTAFVQSTDTLVKSLAREIKRTVLFGSTGEFAHLHFLDAKPAVRYRNESGDLIATQLIGQYNFDNIAAAHCIGKYFEVPESQIDLAIQAYRPDNNRSQLVETATNTLILDAYNANPSSVELALRSFAAMDTDRTKTVILGDMLELGDHSVDEHQAIVSLLAELALDHVLLVGDEYKKCRLEAGTRHFSSKEELHAYLEQHPLESRFILIKGSRSLQMESVQAYL